MVSLTETLWQQLFWVALSVFMLYLFTVYGESIRKGWGARMTRALQIIREDIRTVIVATISVVGVVFGIVNPMNVGAGVEALAAFVAPVWAIFATGIMSTTNALGLTGFSIAMIIPLALLVGAIAFALRQRSLLEEGK